MLKFGPVIARELRTRRPRPSVQWHLDENGHSGRWQAIVAVAGRRQRSEVLDLLIQPKRDKAAALKLMRKLLN